uniref:Cortical granule lectin-like n=1 Tax=Ciona intestinalis TaxID=7719 RepID=F6QVV8_CIOIN
MTFVTISDTYETKNYTSMCKGFGDITWKIVTTLAFIISLVALILSVRTHVNVNDAGMPILIVTPSANSVNLPRSCHEIRNHVSGVYTIKPKGSIFPFKTYCEMQDQEGGWTLVASIHENNIHGKCSPGDKWSSEQGGITALTGSGNWANRNTFGNLEAVTSQDYKNSAYMDVNGSNVMLWHVRNGVRLSDLSRRAHFKYLTTDNVLLNNGKSLQRLYRDHVPLKLSVGGLKPLIQSINATSVNTTSLIPGWFNYRYSSSSNAMSILDGGNDMYDTGNKVSFRVNGGNFTQAYYDRDAFLYQYGVEFSTATIYPFLALAWIGNNNGALQSFDIKVYSNYGADGSGRFSTYNTTTITLGDFTIKYRVFNVYAARDPSVCEVYFYMGSRNKWHSKFPSMMESISWGTSTSHATNIVRVSGSPEKIVFGYTLLSKRSGLRVTADEVTTVLSEYIKAANDFTFKFNNERLTAQSRIFVGSRQLMNETIPAAERKTVQFGEIQFRAYNSIGFPNALCAGFSTISTFPERMCLGGINTYRRVRKQCGDFAAWEGNLNQYQNSNPEIATESGRSRNEINSTILLFVK